MSVSMADRKYPRRIPRIESIDRAVGVIGEYLKQHGAHVQWGGGWNKSTITAIAMASWLDAMKAAQFPSESQIAAWVERYNDEYLANGSPTTMVYFKAEMLAPLNEIAEILRDYSAGLIYFGEARFSARLIFAMSLWRYAEEIQATQATQESGA